MTKAPFDPPPHSAQQARAPGNIPPDEAALRASLDELVTSAEEPTLTRIAAKRIEDAFISAFRARLGAVGSLPSALDGSIYDFNIEKESWREWEEREDAARHLIRSSGAQSALRDMPVCRATQMTVHRKPLFGASKPRVSVIAACWSPLEALAKGSVDPEGVLAGIEAIDWVLERALVHERPSVYHYIGICATTGWDPMMLDPTPDGPNYSITLIEPRRPGWMVHAGETWPLPLLAAIEPEDIVAKKRRVESLLRSADELQVAGGLLLLDELVDRANVPQEIALDVAYDFVQRNPDMAVEKVQGSMIIRRKRGF